MDILKIEGVVVRLIPKVSESLYRWTPKRPIKPSDSFEVMHTNRGPVKMVREITTNKLGGKYLITFKTDQFSTVQFNSKYDGMGDTIELAFEDALSKGLPVSVIKQLESEQ